LAELLEQASQKEQALKIEELQLKSEQEQRVHLLPVLQNLHDPILNDLFRLHLEDSEVKAIMDLVRCQNR
ncbi:MAG: hypothetical protein AAF621_03310, partial [Pseudomonadota bacterium]